MTDAPIPRMRTRTVPSARPERPRPPLSTHVLDIAIRLANVDKLDDAVRRLNALHPTQPAWTAATLAGWIIDQSLDVMLAKLSPGSKKSADAAE